MSAPEVLLNDFKRQWAEVGPAAIAATNAVGASGWYILGPRVRQLEQALSPVMRREHAIGCGSGMDAIEIALRAARVTPGAKVLTTPLSAFATTLAIMRAGLVPVFVDVDESGFVCASRARAALAADPAIRAMVPVHLYGHAGDLSALKALRDDFGVLVIEDCAQAIGATSRGRFAGTVGQLATTSFYPTKNLGALGDGGAVVTDDPALATLCRSLRDYGQSGKYAHEELGLNSRLDELHAAILTEALLPRLAGWTERRRDIAGKYRSRIANPRVKPLPAPKGSDSVWHLYPVLVPSGSRDAFMHFLRERGIQSAVHYPRLIPKQRALAGQPHEVRGSLRVAEDIAAREVSLPIHPYLEDGEVDRVIEAVNDWQRA